MFENVAGTVTLAGAKSIKLNLGVDLVGRVR
jgi:hypothetical protein